MHWAVFCGDVGLMLEYARLKLQRPRSHYGSIPGLNKC